MAAALAVLKAPKWIVLRWPLSPFHRLAFQGPPDLRHTPTYLIGACVYAYVCVWKYVLFIDSAILCIHVCVKCAHYYVVYYYRANLPGFACMYSRKCLCANLLFSPCQHTHMWICTFAFVYVCEHIYIVIPESCIQVCTRVQKKRRCMKMIPYMSIDVVWV